MRWLKALVAEIVGLFVDDGWFAAAIVVWLGLIWRVLPHLASAPGWAGVLLFAGLAAILTESALRRSRH